MPSHPGLKQINVFDISGRVVRHLESSDAEVQLDLNGELPGLYVLQVRTEGESVSVKIVLE
jgi:hypothetical protein